MALSIQVYYVLSHTILFYRGYNPSVMADTAWLLVLQSSHNYSVIPLLYYPTKCQFPAANVGKMKPFKFLHLTILL